MSAAKLAIALDERLLWQIDDLVERQIFRSRAAAVEEAVAEKLARLSESRLERECAKLDPAEEQAMADEGLAEDFAAWPEY